MQNVAVIGYGYWGPKIVRNLLSRSVQVSYVVDVDQARCEEVKRAYPSVNAVTDMDVAMNDPSVTAIIVVLPVKLHYMVAKKALLAGKHVLLEKPIASSSIESEELLKIAKEKDLLLMVDHTYLYSDAVRKIKEVIVENDARIIHISSNRSNLGVFRRDVNVLWDLAPHDLSIIRYITDKSPKVVSAMGYCHNEQGVEDVATLSLDYGTFTADITTSWISPEKIRLFEIITDKFMIVFNDLEKEEKIRIYDAGFKTDGKFTVCWNNGVRKINSGEEEPLSKMLKDFIDCIEGKTVPVSSASVGVDVVNILEASDKSISEKGRQIGMI